MSSPLTTITPALKFLSAIKTVTLPGVGMSFMEITPEHAAELLKRNRKNRKLKQPTAEALAVDLRNGAFLTTHQGIAFNENGDLIDGQHRLEAVVLAKRPIVVLVSWGWPVSGKFQVMDAVDRGTQRSLADQLSVQHGIEDAKRTVQIVNAIAAACFGALRVSKSTTQNILAVLELFPAEIIWVLQFKSQSRGLQLATVSGVMALASAVSKTHTEDFYRQLLSGENLSADNPILPLRNWLLAQGSQADASEVRNAVANHLVAHAKKQKATKLLDDSDDGMQRILKTLKDRILKVCQEYNRTPPEYLGVAVTAARAVNSEESREVFLQLQPRFTSTDLRARLDDGAQAGRLLLIWKNSGWVEAGGLNEFIKTTKGKAVK